jgi:copper(I)-binding protein
MRWLPVTLAFAGALAFAAPPDATRFQFGSLRVDRPIARATPPGATTAAVYFTIDNIGNTTDRLLHASTPVAGGVVLHQMVQKDGMMVMRAVPSLEIIPGARFELSPGGYHLMLIELKQPLKAGERFPLVLRFERTGTVTATVLVEDIGATPAGKR